MLTCAAMNRPSAPRLRWDIFCSVVDNFGDIGICWRLARQLAAEHGQEVRLWVDDLASFRRIAPAIEPAAERQHCGGIEVRHWSTPFPPVAPEAVGEVVVEALACTLPEPFVAAMAARRPAPLWLNLEYLSAEAWVAGCHGLPSPHPRLPLTKYFFFPGFVAGTGGLLRERELLSQRRAFQRDAAAVAAFWDSVGLPPPAADELRLSLFGYGCAGLGALVERWAGSERPVTVVVPEGGLANQVAALFGAGEAGAGAHFVRGMLRLHVLPFLEQERFDRLLWACDLNFVRGEDSFVRAQWAGRPLVWQIYRQQEGAHWPKLEAFLDLYCAGLPAPAAGALRAFWLAWNREEGVAEAWPEFLAARETLAHHAQGWAQRMACADDLAGNLMLFGTKHI